MGRSRGAHALHHHGTVVAIKQYGGQIRELVIDFDLLPEEKTLVVSAVQMA